MSVATQLLVIDPACFRPEVDCFNHIVELTDLKCHYHLPAIRGVETLQIAGYTAEQLAGIVILGSASSVNDAYEWQTQLRQWLQPLLVERVPTLGLCFGHQMLGYMFGSKVDYLREDREKLKGFRSLNLKSDELWGHVAISGESFVSHCEIVTELGADLIALSNSDTPFNFDTIRHRNLPIWGFQSHLETTPVFAANHGIEIDTATRLQFGQSILQNFLNYCRESTR